MLVFLSDLHFTDGSAGQHNPTKKTFELVFKDLAGIARSGGSKEIKIVLLGDIFDLLRTQKWFEASAEARPWGSDKAAAAGKAKEILEATIANNQEALDLFSGDLQKSSNLPAPPEITYVVGNHDRLLVEFPELFETACASLGASTSSHSRHSYLDERYGVFARHGHEYDVYNYAGDSSYSDDEYKKMPIGDPITTELAARLPYLVVRNPLVQEKLSKDELKALDRNLKEIDNVRPLSATLRWLRNRVRPDDWLSRIVEDAVDQAVREFRDIPKVRRWFLEHDDRLRFWEAAPRLRAALAAAEKMRVTALDAVLWAYDKVANVGQKDGRDSLAYNARKELSLFSGDPIFYVLYGHTHQPQVVPLTSSDGLLQGTPGDARRPDCFYINTGAYRPWNAEALKGGGFVSWKQLTYTVFYTPAEASAGGEKKKYPTFDTWTGNRYDAG